MYHINTLDIYVDRPGDTNQKAIHHGTGLPGSSKSLF